MVAYGILKTKQNFRLLALTVGILDPPGTENHGGGAKLENPPLLGIWRISFLLPSPFIPWGTALVGFKISNYIAIIVFFQPPNYFCHCYKYNLLHKRFIFAAVAVYPHVMN